MRLAATPALVAATLLVVQGSTAASGPTLFIFGGRGHKTFLGCLTCGETHAKSVWNEMSQFGFKNDFGVWNPFREFVNPFSSTSMCNEFASDPPTIVDEAGDAYGRLTLNDFINSSVCGATGNDRLCRAFASCARQRTDRPRTTRTGL